jgi:flagellar hook assembly protein FlgD
VEAAVDDVRILAQDGGSAVGVPVVGAPAPRTLQLGNAQPNPFDAATRIEFSLPSRGEVELSIYNVQGQKVGTLVRGMREAGQYDATWDGRDETGARVSTGVYFYRLIADGKVLTKKMTVLK